MDLEVQEMNGKKITSLNAGKQKGINVVDWNFTTKTPKIAAAKTLAYGGFKPLRVYAGTYKIVMTKGKDVYAKNIVVKNDPKSKITLEDRKQQANLAQKLFKMNENLAYKVY